MDAVTILSQCEVLASRNLIATSTVKFFLLYLTVSLGTYDSNHCVQMDFLKMYCEVVLAVVYLVVTYLM